MLRWLAALWLAFIAAPLAAQTFPPLTGRVVDNADLLSPAQEVDLSSKLEALDARTGRQFVIATVPSLEGRTIEDYGYRLGRTWAIGDKQRDDGVILLVAPKERKVRIETGYGARVFLTDAVSSIIVRDTILPRFKAGDMPGGIVAGAGQIISMMELPPAEAAKRAKEIEKAGQDRARQGDGGGFSFIFLIFIFFFVVLPIIRGIGRGGRRRRRGGIDPAVILWGANVIHDLSRGNGGSSWGGGGGGDWGGGGFSGGGGSFGGGGASGGW